MTTLFQPNLTQKIALLGYSFLWLLLIPFTLLHFIVQKLKGKPGYGKHRLSRYGCITSEAILPHGILIHCASVGEVVAVQSLVETLLQRHPQKPITITTNTTTGADRVALLFSDKVQHAYLPYDFPLFSWAFLKKIQPEKVLINEMELWPNFCHVCWKRDIPLFVINARMSNNSVATYQKFPALFSPMFAKITGICVQGERDLANYLSLGIAQTKLFLTNNIKFDLSFSDAELADSKTIEQTFNLTNRQLIVAGSTHEPEEQILIDAFQELRKYFPQLLLVIVPRHPQRFESVHQLLCKQGLSVALISQKQSCNSNTQVLLCDQMGTLRSIYGLADIAFVGGSLAPKGGHNALEPAAMGVPILMGPSRFNNPAICQTLSDAGAMQLVEDSQQIVSRCRQWLENPEKMRDEGQAGKHVLAENSGAMQKTLEILRL